MTGLRDNNGGRRLEMIEYPDGEDLVDHKGRSKPLYKPSTPRPRQWRPNAVSRFLLGLFPGLRLMVTKSVPAGLPYAILGLLAGLGALLVVLNWSVSTATIRYLHVQPRWILIRVVAVLVLAGVYELLRFGSAVEENPRGPRTPRLLSALVMPAFLIILGAPAFLDAEPRLVESMWFCALVVGFGALPAAIACVLDAVTTPGLARFRVTAGLILAALVAVVVFLPALGVPVFTGLGAATRAAGFRVLPTLLP